MLRQTYLPKATNLGSSAASMMGEEMKQRLREHFADPSRREASQTQIRV